MVGHRWHIIVIGTVLALAVQGARAENLDAGKPAPALFARTCAACHASPKGLARDTSNRGLVDFLRQHYTSSPESAGALAAYLIANPGAKQAPAGGRAAATESPGAKRRPGQTPEPAAKSERPPHQTATARPDSMIEPSEARRPHEARPEEPAKGAGRGKRQQAKQQETPAPPPAPAAEPPAAEPPAASAAPAAPVAAAPAPPPDQPAFSAPSP